MPRPLRSIFKLPPGRDLFKSFLLPPSLLLIICCGLILFIGSEITTTWVINDFCQNYVSAQRFLTRQIIYQPITCFDDTLIPSYAEIHYPAHPPFSVFMYIPFTLFKLIPATQIWLALSILTYYVAILILLKSTKMYTQAALFILTLGSLCWWPYNLANSVHNMIQLLFLLLVLAFYFYRRNHLGLSGFILGLAALIKIWPAGLILAALVCKKYKLTSVSVITIICGALLTLASFGLPEHLRYLSVVLPNEKFFYPDPGNISIPGQISKLLFGFHFFKLAPLAKNVSLSTAAMVSDISAATLFILSLASILFLSHKSHHRFDDFLIFSLMPLLVFLAFPISWDWGLVTFLLPLFILIEYLKRTSTPSPRWSLVFILTLVPILFPHWNSLSDIFYFISQDPHLASFLTSWITLGLMSIIGLMYQYFIFLTLSTKTHIDRRKN